MRVWGRWASFVRQPLAPTYLLIGAQLTSGTSKAIDGRRPREPRGGGRLLAGAVVRRVALLGGRLKGGGVDALLAIGRGRGASGPVRRVRPTAGR